MPLESTMICLDNSDWMRNGDYIPTRLNAQQDAASLLCTQRTDSHPESTVGLLTMAGKGVEVLVSPTENIGKILAAFSAIKPEGAPELAVSVSIAQLALRHRKNKNGGQRIVIFIGSPVRSDEKELKKMGSLLKKNNIAVDVVVMGEHDEVQDKMAELVNAANTNDNSHLIIVPPGVQPSDALTTSPLFQGEGGGAGGMNMGGDMGAGGGGGGDLFAEYGGIDPSLDPELAMVMRASAEEARQREEARLLEASKASVEESKQGSDESKQDSTAASSSSTEITTETTTPATQQQEQSSTAATTTAPQSFFTAGDFGGSVGGGLEDDDEALLQAALAISLQDGSSSTATTSGGGTEENTAETSTVQERVEQEMQEQDEEYDDDMDEEMRLALAMSMEEEQQTPTPPPTTTSSSTPAVLLDSDFVSQLLGSVEVDQDDPLIQAALQQMNNTGGDGGGEGKEKEGGDSDASAGKKRKEDDR